MTKAAPFERGKRLNTPASVFKETYNYYLKQISGLDLNLLAEKLGVKINGEEAMVDLLDKTYKVSGKGIIGSDGKRPSFDICIILSKYFLLCPEVPSDKKDWVAYRDFKDSGPLLNFYANDIEKPIAQTFSGKGDILRSAGKKLGGVIPELDLSYDFFMQFKVLPKIPVLLLFNDADTDFPATCSVLFQRNAETHLDAECLAMVGALLYNCLKRADKP